MSSGGSVSRWLASLKSGDMEAAQKLWDRYRQRLLELASRRLNGAAKSVADEEDVTQNVFVKLCENARLGKLDKLENRDDLWWLLMAMTRRKAVDQIRHDNAIKRGGGNVQTAGATYVNGEPRDGNWPEELIGSEPTPEFLAIMDEETSRLLGLLREARLREIAVARIEGYTVSEIAANYQVSTRSIERKLQLIRNKWTREFVNVDR